MKKFYYLLLMLFMGVSTSALARQEATTITEWDGTDKKISLKKKGLATFSYEVAESGVLFIYAKEQPSIIPLSIWGGRYEEGTYQTDSLQDTGAYAEGVGIYGWIKVSAGDVLRFTIEAANEGKASTTITLKSQFFSENFGGDGLENPIELTKDKGVEVPVYVNAATEVLPDFSRMTFCKFVAPSDGVASINTAENIIYYVEAEKCGQEEFKNVSPTGDSDDHEFLVEKDKTYLVAVPNNRPTKVTFKMIYDRLGLTPKFPKELTEFPASIDLEEGNNYYAFSHELINKNNILEIALAVSENDTIAVSYMEDFNDKSTELETDSVVGPANVVLVKNVDKRFLSGDKVIVNFSKVVGKGVANLSLRKPGDGESMSTAIAVNVGGNVFNGPARDYWFVCSSESDVEYSFTTANPTNDTLKHVNYSDCIDMMTLDNTYRVRENEKIYVCVTRRASAGEGVLTVEKRDVERGDYCDVPVLFNLGEELNVLGCGMDRYYSFEVEENGLAVFQSTNTTIHFRGECGGGRINPEEIRAEEDKDMIYTYKLPVEAGHSYIVELERVEKDITISTSFKTAAEGEIYSTAVEMEGFNENVGIDYQFEVAKWYKITADKDGFYAIKAKLGQSSNMKIKIEDASEKNVDTDWSEKDAVAGGFKSTKVYLEEGQTLYLYTKTGSSNDETKFSAEFYFVVSYVGEARPGEDAAVAISVETSTEYVVLKNDENGYEQWYTYTIPARRKAVFTYSTTVAYSSNPSSLYREDKTTTMSAGKGDFTQENITAIINEEEVVVGRRITFAPAAKPRTIYIKFSTINTKFYPEPIVWQIVCDDTIYDDVVDDDEDVEGDNTGGDNTGGDNVGDDNTGGDNTGDDNTGGENEDEDNGIDAEELPAEAAVVYDLMGRRVANPTKGLYIVNGVKRIVK